MFIYLFGNSNEKLFADELKSGVPSAKSNISFLLAILIDFIYVI